MTLSNFKFKKGLGFVNSLIAAKMSDFVVSPLEKLKLDVERLLKEYKPPEHVVEELELTWRGGLWRMALEAALGVQYLHHHRYERSASERRRRSAAGKARAGKHGRRAGEWRGRTSRSPTNSSFALALLPGTGAMGESATTGRPTRWWRRRLGGRCELKRRLPGAHPN
jgi:hypothetical protein